MQQDHLRHTPGLVSLVVWHVLQAGRGAGNDPCHLHCWEGQCSLHRGMGTGTCQGSGLTGKDSSWPPRLDTEGTGRGGHWGRMPGPGSPCCKSSQGTAQSKSEEGEECSGICWPQFHPQLRQAVHSSPVPSDSSTPQNIPGWGHTAPPTPTARDLPAPPASFQAAQTFPASCPCTAPWHRFRGLPRTPHFGAGVGVWLQPRPQGLPCGFSSLRSSLSITPSASAHHHRGGRGGTGAGSSRGVTPGAPREQRGEDGAPSIRAPPLPQPSASSPGSTSPSCFFPLVSSLAGFTWGTF